MESTEKQPIEVLNLPDFWSLLCASEKRLLAFDYDGTLTPFHIDSMKAHERNARMRTLRRSVHRQDIFFWVNSFLKAGIAKDQGSFPHMEFFVPTQ